MNTIRLILMNKRLCSRIRNTLIVLVALRVLYSIPTPGVNLDYFKGILESVGTLAIINSISGNGLSDLSIMTLSITPYITASIIMQLMGVIFPKVKELQTGMKDDKRKIEIASIVLGVVIALLQGTGMAFGFGSRGLLVEYKWYWALLVAFIWTVGSSIAIFAGTTMSNKKEYFIGNGVSLILFTNIASSLLSDVSVLYEMFISGNKIPKMVLNSAIIVCMMFAVIIFTVYLQGSEKNLWVTNSRKVKGSYSNNTHSFPIKLCIGGVVPIIFASSILGMPVLIAQMLGKGGNTIISVLNSNQWFKPTNPLYSVGALVYVALIVVFSYFYGDMVFNPAELAMNLKKQGSSIVGIRAGKSTEDYIRHQVNVITGIGAMFLSVIALVPTVLSGLFGVPNLAFMGTSVIIIVGVVVEMREVIKSENKATASYASGLGGITNVKRKRRFKR